MTFQVRSSHQCRVDEFMRLANQELPSKPQLPSFNVLALRAAMIFEEAVETVKALGFDVHCSRNGDRTILSLIPDPTKLAIGLSLIEIVDGCCNLAVVTTGTLSACGVSDLSVQAEVDANNLAKFGPGHQVRKDGTLSKPPGHRPPDLDRVLKEQGYVPAVRV